MKKVRITNIPSYPDPHFHSEQSTLFKFLKSDRKHNYTVNVRKLSSNYILHIPLWSAGWDLFKFPNLNPTAPEWQ